MKPSILPILIVVLFAFIIFITQRAKRGGKITLTQAHAVNILILALGAWTAGSFILGLRGVHTSPWLLESVPLLWQATIAVTIAMTFMIASRSVRSGLHGIAQVTPISWLVFVQAVRIGALGGIIKGIRGEITSGFVFWVGIPDFIYGVSAIVIGFLLLRGAIGNRTLLAWSLLGPAIILVPMFGMMSYWMNEPGFIFIFEFPMVLAPSIVLPVLLLLNFLLAWRAIGGRGISPVNRPAVAHNPQRTPSLP